MTMLKSIAVLYISDAREERPPLLSKLQDYVQTHAQDPGYVDHLTYNDLASRQPLDPVWDVVLLDARGASSLALDVVRERAGPAQDMVFPPIVIIVAEGEAPLAAQALDLGAESYLIDDKHGHYLELLPHVVARAIASPSEGNRRDNNNGHYQHYFENVGDPILVHTLEGWFLEVNSAACQQLGYRRDELLKKRVHDIIEPELVHRLPAQTERLHQENPIVFETVARRANGTDFPVEVSSRLTTRGDASMIISSLRDITSTQHALAQKTVELEREQRLRKVIEANADAMVVTDQEGMIRLVNPAAEQLLGRSAAELVGEPLGRPLNNDQQAEIDILTPLGTPAVAEMSVVKINWDDTPAYLTSLRDITTRRQAQEALTWESTLNAAVAELSQALISSVSLEHISWMVLKKAKQLTTSEFGFVGYINPENGTLISASMTRDIWDTCKVQGKDIVFHEFAGLWGWVLKQRRPLMTNHPPDDPRSTGVPEGHIPVERFLSAPAMMGDNLVGQIALVNPTRDYTERDLAVIKRLASLYALAVENQRAQQALQQYAEKQGALYAIGTAVASLQMPDELLQNIIEEIVIVLRAKAAWLAIPDTKNRDTIKMIASESLPDNWCDHGFFSKLRSDACVLVDRMKNQAGTEAELEVVQQCEQLPLNVLGYPDGQGVCIPIRVGGQTLGTLSLIWDTPNPFISDYTLLKAMGQQIGIALHNARLYQDARQVNRLRMLNDLDSVLQATLDPETVARVTLEHITEAMGADRSTLLLCAGQQTLCFDPGNNDQQQTREAWSSPTMSPAMLERLQKLKATLLEHTEFPDREMPVLVKHYPMFGDLAMLDEDKLWTPNDMVAPIMNEEGIVGLIILGLQDDRRAFNHDDLALLRAAANRAGQTLRNAHLYQASQRQAQRLALLNTISSLAAASLEPETVLEHILNRTTEAVGAEEGSILLTENAHGDAIFTATVGQDVLHGHRVVEGQGIAGWVAQHNEPVIVNDVQHDPRFYSGMDVVTGFKTRSLLCAPLRHRSTVTGVIEMVNKRRGGFTTEDLELLEAVASIASVALENARLYTRTRQRAEELAQLNEFNLALTSTLDFETVVDAALKQVRRLFQADLVSMFQPTDDKQALVVPQALVHNESWSISTQTPVNESVSGWVYQNRRPLLIADFDQDSRYNPAYKIWGEAKIHAGMVAPLLMQGEAIGVVVVGHEKPGFYTVTDLQTLQSLASTLAVAVQNAQLYEDLRSLLRERERTQAHMIHTEKMAALGRLVASLAHEINNPLQAVQGCLTLAQEEFDEIEISSADQEALRYYLTIAEEEIERISTIVRRMRDFYRPAREGTQQTDVHDVLDTILALAGKQLQHSDVEVVRDWDRNPCLLKANPDHLKQVFLNLVLNAIDAMPDGGTLTIRTAMGQLDLMECEAPTSALRIEFIDTGFGMPPDVRSRIFEPFFTTKEQGSGLGLSISYSIVKAHGGKVNVISEPGEGTTFTILLPCETIEEPAVTV